MKGLLTLVIAVVWVLLMFQNIAVAGRTKAGKMGRDPLLTEREAERQTTTDVLKMAVILTVLAAGAVWLVWR